MIRRPPRSTLDRSSAASDVYKRQILVTALTNRALVELAEKEHLKTELAEGKIFKSALTADESKNKKIRGLKAVSYTHLTLPTSDLV